MSEQHTWDEFSAAMDSIDRGGGGPAAQPQQKPDAFSIGENSAKSPTSIILDRASALKLLSILDEAAACMDMLRDLTGDLGPESDAVEEVILSLCDVAELISEALDV